MMSEGLGFEKVKWPKQDPDNHFVRLDAQFGGFGLVLPKDLTIPKNEKTVADKVKGILETYTFPVLNIEYSATAAMKQDDSHKNIRDLDNTEGMLIEGEICPVQEPEDRAVQVEVLGLNPYQTISAKPDMPPLGMKPDIGALIAGAGMAFPAFAPFSPLAGKLFSGLGLFFNNLINPPPSIHRKAYLQQREMEDGAKRVFGWYYGKDEDGKEQGPHYSQVFLRVSRPKKEGKPIQDRVDIRLGLTLTFTTAWRRAENIQVQRKGVIGLVLPKIPSTPDVYDKGKVDSLPLTIRKEDVRAILGVSKPGADGRDPLDLLDLKEIGGRITKGSLMKAVGL